MKGGVVIKKYGEEKRGRIRFQSTLLDELDLVIGWENKDKLKLHTFFNGVDTTFPTFITVSLLCCCHM